MDAIQRRSSEGRLADDTAIRRLSRVIRKADQYERNIENRLNRRRDYQALKENTMALRRSGNTNYADYQREYGKLADKFLNTSYSRNTYMGNNGG